jgi:phage regulator Rha-like protein
MNQKNLLSIPDEIIISKIYLIRGIKVMLDRDLAVLYTVETKRLKEAVRRNIIRFPEDFMFELTNEEFNEWRTKFSKSQSDKKGLRHSPFAFTEHGVLMLASVLNSERAIQVNIQIVRIFARMRQLIVDHKEFVEKFRQIEIKLSEHDNQILVISEYLRQLEQTRQQQEEQAIRKRIGFRPDDKI